MSLKLKLFQNFSDGRHGRGRDRNLTHLLPETIQLCVCVHVCLCVNVRVVLSWEYNIQHQITNFLVQTLIIEAECKRVKHLAPKNAYENVEYVFCSYWSSLSCAQLSLSGFRQL